MENDLAELQMLLMEQQRSLESIGEQLIIQSNKVSVLEKKVNLLAGKLRDFGGLSGQDNPEADPQPPHY